MTLPFPARYEPLIHFKDGNFSFMRGLVGEVPNDGITANAVLPDLANTAASALQPEDQKCAAWERQAIKRMG
jgi:NAD(P)-dependent dehydrogenase (short-subunit alcohol dehydrogenase family)